MAVELHVLWLAGSGIPLAPINPDPPQLVRDGSARRFEGLEAAQRTVEEAAWATIAQANDGFDRHGSKFIAHLVAGDGQIAVICILEYDHRRGVVEPDPTFRPPSRTEIAQHLKADDAQAVLVEPRLHVVLTVPIPDRDGRGTGSEYRPLTDSSAGFLAGRNAPEEYNAPLTSGRPYRGADDATARLQEFVDQPPADLTPEQLRKCRWEAWVGLGYMEDAATGTPTPSLYRTVAMARWYEDKGGFKAVKQKYVDEELVAVQDVVDPRISASAGYGSLRYPKRQHSLYGLAFRLSGLTVYDLADGRYLHADTLPAVRERDEDRRERDADRTAPVPKVGHRPPAKDW